MKSLVEALEKEHLKDPSREEKFKLGIGKGKGKPTKKKAKGNAQNPASERSVGHSGGKYMKLIGAA